MEGRQAPSAWDQLHRTAETVRAEPTCAIDPRAERNLALVLRRALTTAAVVAAGGFAVLHMVGATQVVSANTSADASLFSLTNSDRTSNGVHSVAFSGTLQSIGENARYNCNGISVSGRSYDMIHRNYFAHPILGCGQYVFSMMQAYGVRYRQAGENIGWVNGNMSTGAAAGYINSSFMASPDHRSNILNGNYTEMGVGSDESAPGVVWTGVSPGQTGVWMFSEEFAQVGSSPPPRPGPRPTPKPPVSRNSPLPAAPRLVPATTAPRSATPSQLASPTAVPIPIGSLPANLPAPPVTQYQGLLPNSIESVLEAFLTL
jgi:uncharacterized protein YkwD